MENDSQRGNLVQFGPSQEVTYIIKNFNSSQYKHVEMNGTDSMNMGNKFRKIKNIKKFENKVVLTVKSYEKIIFYANFNVFKLKRMIKR